MRYLLILQFGQKPFFLKQVVNCINVGRMKASIFVLVFQGKQGQTGGRGPRGVIGEAVSAFDIITQYFS